MAARAAACIAVYVLELADPVLSVASSRRLIVDDVAAQGVAPPQCPLEGCNTQRLEADPCWLLALTARLTRRVVDLPPTIRGCLRLD